MRNHGGIPTIDPSQYELEIEGLVKNPRKIDLATLQDSNIFPQHTVLATIMCSGNRRMELQSAYPGEGDELVNAPWQQRAISTAKWTGVSLRNVMDYCGGPATGASHVEFIGADTYFKKNKVHSYAASVPWLKVRRDEVLLAWEMNGQPLPKLHGHPLRVVILGSVGARSVKWLFRVRALDQPSMSPVQRVEYLLQNHQIGKHNGDFVTGMPIMDLPVNSAFLSPSDTDVVIHEGKIHVKGWAYSGGGRWPEIVEVSADNGYSWYEVPFDNITEKHVWTLRLWEMELPVSAQGWVALKCRCWDNSLNVQPSDYRDTWNWSTHVNHSAHTLKIFSIDKRQKGTILQLENVKSQGKSLSPITLPVPFREEDPGSRWTEPPELTPAWARS